MAKFYSTKTYGNDRGLSCCFRQWRSTHSHCSLLHGYSIGVRIVFECETLDERNWVMDFGGLKKFKEWLEYMFDHTLVVAEDDPHLEFFKQMSNLGKPVFSGTGELTKVTPWERESVCDIRIVEGVGCEKFSELAFKQLSKMLDDWKKEGTLLNKTVKVKSVEVFEHEGNSAIYEA